MSIRKKLILMGICVIIILVILTVNVIRRITSEEKTNTGETTVKENVITRAEAFRLLSYLEYDKAGREGLSEGITYADTAMSGWYDSYVNAVWKMGLIEGNVTITPKEALTYGYCKEMLDKLIMAEPGFQGIYAGLTFDFINSEEDMLIGEFLEVYEAALKLLPQEKAVIKEETLFVLAREISEDGKDRIVTDLGRYYYDNCKDYSGFLMQPDTDGNTASVNGAEAAADKGAGKNTEAAKTTDEKASEDKPDAAESADPKVNEQKEQASEAGNGSGNSLTGEDFQKRYINQGIKAMVCGQEIVYLKGITVDPIIIHNVWIKQGKDLLVDTFINGIDKAFNAQNRLSTSIEKVVGDIIVKDQRVVGISVKPDLIHGKVLLTGKDFIEVEGYGKVPLEEDYRIYKIYGELSMEQTNSILVGYETTDFVVSGGKISAALIREGIKAENIRVLLHTTGYGGIFHDSVELTCNTAFTVKNDDSETEYEKDETIKLEPGSEMLTEGRIKIVPKSEKGRIQILSIERSTGNPKYRGSIEISEGEEGLLIVNELPLEEYLYAVIPSEMPTYYGLEALKVQAVCARSYAYRHLLANSLSSYGAHVDDSVSYQVYNNIEENEDSILAVKDTYGKVVKYNGEVITAYYFSTSCGHTTNVEDVWANGVATPYLSGRLMAVEEDSEGVTAQEENSLYEDLSKEENFRSFIEDRDFATYDSGFNWYRWHVTMDAKDIKNIINSKLKERYEAYPELIKTLTDGSEKDGDAVYESIPVDTVGDIVDISVRKRQTGGIIYELVITGTKNTILVQTEYNIRVLLSPKNSTVYRLDETGVEGLSLLPSAFFVIDQEKEKGKLKSITLTGGGYGHGVGMSQNGVKSLSDAGKTYEEIVPYFYKDTELGFIYE
jgi:stage II sporulation protein D